MEGRRPYQLSKTDRDVFRELDKTIRIRKYESMSSFFTRDIGYKLQAFPQRAHRFNPIRCLNENTISFPSSNSSQKFDWYKVEVR